MSAVLICAFEEIASSRLSIDSRSAEATVRPERDGMSFTCLTPVPEGSLPNVDFSNVMVSGPGFADR